MVKLLLLFSCLLYLFCVPSTVNQNTYSKTRFPGSERERSASINDTVFLNPVLFSSGSSSAIDSRIEGGTMFTFIKRDEGYYFIPSDTALYNAIFETKSGGILQKETLFINVTNFPPEIKWGDRTSTATINVPFKLGCHITDDGKRLKMDMDWNSDNVIDTTFFFLSSEPELKFTRPTTNGTRDALYKCKFTITDNNGHSVSDSSEIQILFNPPIANAGRNSIYCASVYVPLSAALSRDMNSDGRIVKYIWDMDGDNKTDTTTASPNIEWVFDKAGDFPLVISVVDNDGNFSKPDTAYLTIIRDKPVLSITGTHIAIANQPVVFMGNAKTGCVPIERYMWDFDGDNKWDYHSTTGGRVLHTFKKNGSFNIIFSAIDQKGDSSSYVWPIIVRQ